MEFMNLSIDINMSLNETRRYKEYENITGMVYACSVKDRTVNRCQVAVARGGGVEYELRLREVCTNAEISSQWVYLNKDANQEAGHHQLKTPIPEIVEVKPVMNNRVGDPDMWAQTRSGNGEFLGFDRSTDYMHRTGKK